MKPYQAKLWALIDKSGNYQTTLHHTRHDAQEEAKHWRNQGIRDFVPRIVRVIVKETP